MKEGHTLETEKKPIIVIAGPTASGKSCLAVLVAKAINGAIISADSMQVYRKMDIGTAKVTLEEQGGVDHYLIDIRDPRESFSIADFQKEVKAALDIIYSKGQCPILVGGTGFYIQSILKDVDFTETLPDRSYRDELEKKLEKKLENKPEHEPEHEQEQVKLALHQALKDIDAVSATLIHPNNVKRVIRALEYFHQTGEPISLHNQREQVKENKFNCLYYVLNMERSRLYKRIDQRVDIMFDQGLVDEVKALLAEGYSKDLVSMQGLGYKEIVAAIEGTCSFDEAKYNLKRDTRHFAKRQLTWFKREADIIWLEHEHFNDSVEAIVDKIIKDIEVMKIL